MFANLKNKIREETGGDLPQLGPKHLGHGRLSRGSKGGSTSSMCSEQDNSMLKPKVDWQLQAETLLCEKAVLEEEKSDLVKKNLELAEQLKGATAYRQKAIQYQEDLDQLEGFQTQEIAKVKHLLLEREQQLSEAQTSLGKAQTEISRLRSIQDQLAHLQDSLDAERHSGEQARQRLTMRLEESEQERLVLAEKLAKVSSLVEASRSGQDQVAAALEQASRLAEQRLEEARLELADVKAKWCQQVTALETQVARLSVQAGEEGVERRAAEERLRLAEKSLATLAAQLEQKEEKCSVSSLEAANARLELLLADAKAEAQAAAADGANAAAELEQSRAAERWAAAALAQAQQAHQRLLGDKEDAGKRMEELEAEKKALDTEKKGLQAETKALQAENLALKLCSQHLESVEAEKKALEAKCAQLEANQRNLQLEETMQSTISRLEGECSLLGERTREMEKQMAEANAEKDELQLRNASLSQQSELHCKELQEEISELKASLAKQAPKSQIDELNNKISDLEAQIAEKNKNNKVLTQRLADMKKTLQKEMKSTDAVMPPQQLQQQQQQLPSADKMENNVDVNHEYLKHVVLKFFTSKEYEVAQHLIKAVATLLHFTPEEERLLRETLDWKMSWFGSKPKLAGNNSPRSFPPS
ncbi:golgin subfamily A member 1 isoform X1 [Cloeon dipterum]|uniref:golgin subfamily A member 1 isoform X1 n=1 Tax=Cloeon dipterum TaxID=197152 RepID=UPI00321FED4D